MLRTITIAICRFGALVCFALLLLAIFWPPQGSGGMQFIPFMLAGLVYLVFCLPARKLADSRYQRTALAFALASLVIYLGSIFGFVAPPFGG